MRFSLSNGLLGVRAAACYGNNKLNDEPLQIESTVEPVSKGGQILRCIFSVVERMMSPRQGRLEIAQDGIDPSEFGQVTRLTVSHDGWQVHATCIDHTSKTGQAVTGDDGAGCQVRRRPSFDRLTSEASYRRELRPRRGKATLVTQQG